MEAVRHPMGSAAARAPREEEVMAWAGVAAPDAHHHAARDGPLQRVLSLDGDDLQLAARRVEARHDRVGGVVGAPLAEQPAAGQTGAPHRIERPAVRIKAQALAKRVREATVPHRVGCALLELVAHARRVRWVGPFAAGGQVARVVHDSIVRPRLGRVLRPRGAPSHRLVGHMQALRVCRVLLRSSLGVQLVADAGRALGRERSRRGGRARRSPPASLDWPEKKVVMPASR